MRLLLDKRRELVAPKRDAGSLIPGAGVPEGDLIDQATADANAEVQIRLHETDARLLKAIEEALTRIRRSTYGVCETCGRRIAKARLEAVPWTRLCRECKETRAA